MASEPTVYIVDDDQAVRDSLQLLMEASGHAAKTYPTGTAFLEDCRPDMAGCTLLDINMPEMNGLEIQSRMATDGVDLPVIVVTGHGDVPMAVTAMKAGAVQFIEKPFTDDVILDAVAQAMRIRPHSKRLGASRAEVANRLERLTPREREVLDQLVIGNPNKIIAHEFGLSSRTVEIHRSRVMEKMQARNLSHLIRMALAVGVDPTET